MSTSAVRPSGATTEPGAESRPRLSQFWHPVAVAGEIGDTPQRVRLLGESLVVFRTSQGISAFKDLCVHRGAALSGGWMRGDRIVCPYHGWEYDATGACARIPALPPDRSIPTRARAVAYHVQERYGLVWVAMEDPVAPVPGFPNDEADDPEWEGGLFAVVDWETSAGRSTENSMDISHFPFVHANILGDPAFPEQAPYELHETDWGQWYRVDDQYYSSVGSDEVTRVSYEYFHWYPFTMHIRIIEASGRTNVITVAASPSERARTRVFRLVHRNHPNDDPKFVEHYMHILEQDREVVEAIRPEEIPQSLKEELHLKVPDLASIAYRRWLGGIDTMGVLEP
jgi:phenylpropionate dioxygenase-like ring-hydroxylating dioxygenase large terminal subunit